MIVKRSIGERVFDMTNVLALTFLTIITLYPVLHVAFASISQPTLIMQHQGLLLWPKGLSFMSYKVVFANPMILRGYVNTLFYVIAGTSLNLCLTSLGAYGLSRNKFFWKNKIMAMIILTMFFSGGLIPSYLLVESMGLVDTRWAIILPSAMSTWNLLIMRTSFAAVPESLEESAKIEGANDFSILVRIFIPLSSPVIAVMILYYGVYHWNAWFSAMVYLRDRELYPLQLILREILILNSLNNMTQNIDYFDIERVGETIKYCTIMVATLPILFIYPFLQKYFVKGIMIGAVKG